MITRHDYLEDPERWADTTEEAELVKFCIDYIKNHKNFHFKFSPVVLDVHTNKEYPNQQAKDTDTRYILLSKKVLEVFYGRSKKSDN